MTEREWDKRLHIHTIGREDEADPNYSPYEPTPYSVLQRLADSGHIQRKSHLLDYGCGMLVKLIVDIAKHLKLKVIAEGVETEGQLSLLKDAGCNIVQGFYFSRPVPPDAFEALIEKDLSMRGDD